MYVGKQRRKVIKVSWEGVEGEGLLLVGTCVVYIVASE